MAAGRESVAGVCKAKPRRRSIRSESSLLLLIMFLLEMKKCCSRGRGGEGDIVLLVGVLDGVEEKS